MPQEMYTMDPEGNPIEESGYYPEAAQRADGSFDILKYLEERARKAEDRKEKALRTPEERFIEKLPGFLKPDANRGKRGKTRNAIVNFLLPSIGQNARSAAMDEYRAETAATKTEESDIMRQIGLMTRARENDENRLALKEADSRIAELKIKANAGLLSAKEKVALADAEKKRHEGNASAALAVLRASQAELTDTKTSNFGKTPLQFNVEAVQEALAAGDFAKAQMIVAGMEQQKAGRGPTESLRQTMVEDPKTGNMVPHFLKSITGIPVGQTFGDKSGLQKAFEQMSGRGKQTPEAPLPSAQPTAPAARPATPKAVPAGQAAKPLVVDEPQAPKVNISPSGQARLEQLAPRVIFSKKKMDEYKIATEGLTSRLFVLEAIKDMALNFDQNYKSKLDYASGGMGVLGNILTSVEGDRDGAEGFGAIANQILANQNRKDVTGAGAAMTEIRRLEQQMPQFAQLATLFGSGGENISRALSNYFLMAHGVRSMWDNKRGNIEDIQELKATANTIMKRISAVGTEYRNLKKNLPGMSKPDQKLAIERMSRLWDAATDVDKMYTELDQQFHPNVKKTVLRRGAK